MRLSKSLKKIMISSVALLMFASVGSSASNITVSARHIRTYRHTRIRKHTRENIRLYHHKKNVHKYNLAKLNHRHNVTIWNKYKKKNHTKRAKDIYKEGYADGLTLYNVENGITKLTKKHHTIITKHLMHNPYYRKGWDAADANWVGSRAIADTVYKTMITLHPKTQDEKDLYSGYDGVQGLIQRGYYAN